MRRIIESIIIILLGTIALGGCFWPFANNVPVKPPLDPNTIIQPATQYVDKIIKQTDWLTTIAVVGIALSVAAFVMGQTFAMPLFAGCVTLLTTILVVARYAQWMAFIGFAVALIVFAYTAITRIKSNKLAETTKVASKELVIGIQKVKDAIIGDSEELKKKANAILAGVQSPATVDLVDKLKNEMPITEGVPNGNKSVSPGVSNNTSN